MRFFTRSRETSVQLRDMNSDCNVSQSTDWFCGWAKRYCHRCRRELRHHFEENGFHFVGQDTEGERMELESLNWMVSWPCWPWNNIWSPLSLLPRNAEMHSLHIPVQYLYFFLCIELQLKCIAQPKSVVICNTPVMGLWSPVYLCCVVFPDHCYFVGVQYHPEFTSRPIKPSPPYFGLLLAAAGKLQSYLQKGCRLSPR